jgi:hypothetical protein
MPGRFKKAPIVLAILAWAAAAGAQELRTMTSLYQAVRSGWVQFHVVSGRVSLDTSREINYRSANNLFKQHDQIAIQSINGEIFLTYNWSNDKRQLAIEISNVSKVHISYTGKGDEALIPVDFLQPAQGNTILTIGAEDKRQVYSAPSLWHLFLAYPRETKQHLEPLLELLNPNWKLSETAQAVEIELLRKAVGNEASLQKHWEELVEQLGDERFSTRQAADRALRAANPAVLNYLRQLDFSRLDAEQQFRVRRIIEALSEQLGDDTPEQVANWLAGDASVWLVLLSRPEVATRRLAARRLTSILGAPIPVDPEADPAAQKTQLEQLRLRIEGPAPAEKE